MKTLDEIKKLMADGETAQADEALKELLEKEPDNLQAKMLYGTCRQLLGDEETFRRIHDELVPVMEKCGKGNSNLEEVRMWSRYQDLYAKIIGGVRSLTSGAIRIPFRASVTSRPRSRASARSVPSARCARRAVARWRSRRPARSRKPRSASASWSRRKS